MNNEAENQDYEKFQWAAEEAIRVYAAKSKDVRLQEMIDAYDAAIEREESHKYAFRINLENQTISLVEIEEVEMDLGEIVDPEEAA